jgi:AcrR family transcriptional regulator
VLYQHFPGKLDLYLALLDASADALLSTVRDALTSTTDNSERVAATVRAYFSFVADPGGAFRLVFESDLTNEPAVRVRVDQVNQACAQLVSDVIGADTGLSPDLAMLLAVGLTGSSQVAARWWLTRDGAIPQNTAEELVSTLAWRGISRFPRTGE